MSYGRWDETRYIDRIAFHIFLCLLQLLCVFGKLIAHTHIHRLIDSWINIGTYRWHSWRCSTSKCGRRLCVWCPKNMKPICERKERRSDEQQPKRLRQTKTNGNENEQQPSKITVEKRSNVFQRVASIRRQNDAFMCIVVAVAVVDLFFGIQFALSKSRRNIYK